jgi:hypothetical protein
MAKCPNCGREAARTIDWVCQWCGYPLPEGSFKKIDKSFRELKEESLSPQQASDEVETRQAPEPKPTQETRPKPVFQPGPEPAKKTEPAPIPQQVKKPEPPLVPAQPPVEKPAADANKPIEIKKPEEAIQPEPVANPEPPPPEVKHEPPPADIEITVADLLSAYETDGVAADARFGNKMLKITGIVDKINVKEALNIYSITLNSPKKSILLQGVRCVFDRNYGHALNRLSVGQTVTVQGKYTGSMIDISLRDCFLVQ